jgi:hypothetical protein
VRFAFGIPQGADGLQGVPGLTGAQGPQGAPGEVTETELAMALATTSTNSNAIPQLPGPFADPDAEALRQRLNDLIAALRR